MTPQIELYRRTQQLLDKLQQDIDALCIDDDQFEAWFDRGLFHCDAQHPRDYLTELQRHFDRLRGCQDVQEVAILEHKVSAQLSALYQALLPYQQR